MIIYIFEKDKACGRRRAERRQESHCANVVTAGLPGSSSQNKSVTEGWKKRRKFTHLTFKTGYDPSVIHQECNKMRIWIWISKYVLNN